MAAAGLGLAYSASLQSQDRTGLCSLPQGLELCLLELIPCQCRLRSLLRHIQMFSEHPEERRRLNPNWKIHCFSPLGASGQLSRESRRICMWCHLGRTIAASPSGSRLSLLYVEFSFFSTLCMMLLSSSVMPKTRPVLILSKLT